MGRILLGLIFRPVCRQGRQTPEGGCNFGRCMLAANYLLRTTPKIDRFLGTPVIPGVPSLLILLSKFERFCFCFCLLPRHQMLFSVRGLPPFLGVLRKAYVIFPKSKFGLYPEIPQLFSDCVTVFFSLCFVFLPVFLAPNFYS